MYVIGIKNHIHSGRLVDYSCIAQTCRITTGERETIYSLVWSA